MEDKPRFVIVEQIGHGEFSNVYKARWINPPLIDFSTPCSSTPSSPVNFHQSTNPFLEGYNHYNTNLPLSTNNNDNRMANNTNNNSEKYFALKKIKFYDIQNSKQRMDCLKEVRLLQQLRHPNIINYNTYFMERNELYIVLEFADGGDLSKLINYFKKRKQLISERTILKYFTQVCSAIKYIHSKRILHRDIKPANIFMTSNGCVKLGDFGLGRFFSQNTLNAHSIVGTFYYMSPERIRETGYSFSSDVWSLGCLLYELITLNSPFSVLNIQQTNDQRLINHQNNAFNLQWLIERICRAEYPSLDAYTNINLRLRQLISECLNPIQEARPNMVYMCELVNQVQQLHSNQSNNHTNR